MEYRTEGQTIEIRRSQESSEKIVINSEQDVNPNVQDSAENTQHSAVRHSESDIFFNKSDSDDGFFITDSSDEVMNEVLPDCMPSKERIEQTRETIMQSLVQSFVSIIPDDGKRACDRNETAHERTSTNDENSFDAVDMITVGKDMQCMESIMPARRIPSDSAFSDFHRNVGSQASVDASDEYVTVASASEDPTTVSLFSQSASTSQLQTVSKPAPYGRSKSASSFRGNHRLRKEGNHSSAGLPTCKTVPDPWLLNYGWLKKDSSDLRQDRTKTSEYSESANTPSEEKRAKEPRYSDDVKTETQPGVDSQPKQKAKEQARTNWGKFAFKAAKLPRFYRFRSDKKMASSRSESCVIPKNASRENEQVTLRRSRSSGTKYSHLPMTKPTAKERPIKKDAGGVSYAVRHSLSPERMPGTHRVVSTRVRNQVAMHSPDRKGSSHAPTKTGTSVSPSRPISKEDAEGCDQRNAKQVNKKDLDPLNAHPARPREPDNLEPASKTKHALPGKSATTSVTSRPTPTGSKLLQKARNRSPSKITKGQSTVTVHTPKPPLETCATGNGSDAAERSKQTEFPSPASALKRPTPSQRSGASSLSTNSTPPGPVSSDSVNHHSAGADAGRRASSAETAPALMSLKLDVSVRAEDGSVHSFRDISPPKDGRTGDLFSGVEEFIRGLLEGPAADGGGAGRALTVTPVTVVSPRSVAPRLTGGSAQVSTADRDPMLDVRRATVPPVSPRRSRDLGGEFLDRRAHAPDVHAQRLQAEESVLLLTSTGSMSSTDLWPQAARQIVYPSTTVPVIPVATTRPQSRQHHSTFFGPHHSAEHVRDAEKVGLKPEWRRQVFSEAELEGVAERTTNNESLQRDRSVSPSRAAPSAPPSSPVRTKSAPSSPERSRTSSPRSRIPIPARLFAEKATSRSPTPERRSFYHTAQTTPERPRSSTPDSLRSVGGSSGSLNSLNKLSPVVELENLGGHSFHTASSVADKSKNCNRFHSSCSQYNPRRHNPLGRLCVSSQHQNAERSLTVDKSSEAFICSGQDANGDIHWKRRHAGDVIPSPRGDGALPTGTKQVSGTTTENEHVTNFPGVHSQHSSCVQKHHVSAVPTDNSVPIPMKRSSSEPFATVNDVPVQKPIPSKRTIYLPSVESGALYLRTEQEFLLSTKTSFCSMDSPMKNISPPPPEAQSEELAGETVDQNKADVKISVSGPSAKEELMQETMNQSNYMTPKSKNSRSLESSSGSSLTQSISSCSVGSNLQNKQSNDQAKNACKSETQEHKQRHKQQQEKQQQEVNRSDIAGSNIEREMIETENALRLMEETISLLERQNSLLTANTKDISQKINQERTRRCDLKTAKLMLQKVRLELQKTTKNNEENRMQLINANDKISEQESTIFLLKESLREECIKNVRMNRALTQHCPPSEEGNASHQLPRPLGLDGMDETSLPLLAKSNAVRELLEETETLLQRERKARKDAEEKLVQEQTQKLRILNAAKRWRRQLETGSKPVISTERSDLDLKNKILPRASDSGSSNVKGYRSIHTPGSSNESVKIDPLRCKSNESFLSGRKIDIESITESEYFTPKLTEKRDGECQCDILDGSTNWKDKYAEIKQINDLCMRKMNEVQHDRMELRSELKLTGLKLKEETEKKDRFELELKGLIERIHEMQKDVQLYQRQSREQLFAMRQGDNEKIENLEMEKLKLKDFYQQQMEAIVKDKVSEFQAKVRHLETIVRDQINTYTKSMQQKFKEKLATASLQQKEVISRLQAEHAKEVEQLTAEYPFEIERLQQQLAESRQEVMDNKNRLEQRETQVGTILRVVKLLIREGNAMKGDIKEQNMVEIARKILRCMDLNLDDIVSPRPSFTSRNDQDCDREWFGKDGSCATFRSIPDSPRPIASNRISPGRNAPPIPPRRKPPPDIGGQETKNKSDESTKSQPFNVSGEVTNRISYTRFGDEVIRAKSEESVRNVIKKQAKQLSTVSDLSQWGESGSWTLDGFLPAAPPPTPPSITTSSGTNADQPDPEPKNAAMYVASSVLKGLNQPTRVKTVADKGTGSAASLIRDPSFLLLTNSILTEGATQMCECKRLQQALEECGRLRMTMAHRDRLKEGPSVRERTRSSSETSVSRLASSYLETIETGGIFVSKQLGSSKFNVSSLTSSEQQTNKTQAVRSKSACKPNGDQILCEEIGMVSANGTVKTGGKFTNPFSMKPILSRRTNETSDKITTKPPIQNTSSSPCRPVNGRSASPARQQIDAESVSRATTEQPAPARSRSQGANPFVDKIVSPSRAASVGPKKTSTTLKRMPSFDKVDMLECKESSEDSKFALPQQPLPLELKPRDNKASVQRKQLAAMRRQSPRQQERHRSISPRERKLFTLRNQHHAEKKVTRTEVTKRTHSPTPVSNEAFLPIQARNFVPSFKHKRDRSRSGRRSVSSNMDWKKYIKSGQPWQDVYLHEHNDPDYVEPIPTNGTYYTAEPRDQDSDRSDWSPSYSWAPPRRGERDKWSRYLATGQMAAQVALERFYATPERESADVRRRMRRSRKQAEVMEHIDRLLAASSASDPSEERPGRRVARRSRSHQRQASAPSDRQRSRYAVLDGIRRKALGQLDARHPADLPADADAQRRVSLSLDRDPPMPRRDCSVLQRLSGDVKTHQRLAREHNRQRRLMTAQERSPSQQRWPSDSRRKVPLVLVSRTPRGEPTEHRHHRGRSHSRYRTIASTLEDHDMDSWVDQWERKWDRERKQKPLTHWPAT